ncbi:hypothetical protein [Paenibacillus sp. 1P07SE]|uniref:hypothetical protein n=1 Tax=Paenibacillus sp. 1P07SE TaxID=3132209 RepID=UPI0039A61EA7
MRIWRQLFLSAMLASLAVYVLAELPGGAWTRPSGGQETAAFSPDDDGLLSPYNLVDVLGRQSWYNQLARVQWDGSELAVDFAVGPEAESEQINGDLLAMLDLAFVGLSNVDRLLIRFLEEESVHVRLLMAADVRSSDAELKRYLPGLSAGDMLQPQWRALFRISVTSQWVRRYGSLAE